MGVFTDYGHPEREFFFQKSRILGMDRHFGLNCFEAFGVFLGLKKNKPRVIMTNGVIFNLAPLISLKILP